MWYDEEPQPASPVDWIIYHQRSRAVKGAKSKPFYAYGIDLTRSKEQLRGQISRDTAYKIRVAQQRDKIVCERLDPRDGRVLDGFEEVYNRFAGMKRLARLSRPRTESMAAAGVLDLCAAKDPSGEILVYQANHLDGCQASGLQSASLYRAKAGSAERNFIGRANRLLVWDSILVYKKQGLK